MTSLLYFAVCIHRWSCVHTKAIIISHKYSACFLCHVPILKNVWSFKISYDLNVNQACNMVPTSKLSKETSPIWILTFTFYFFTRLGFSEKCMKIRTCFPKNTAICEILFKKLSHISFQISWHMISLQPTPLLLFVQIQRG